MEKSGLVPVYPTCLEQQLRKKKTSTKPNHSKNQPKLPNPTNQKNILCFI